jgi:hypothetical protein
VNEVDATTHMMTIKSSGEHAPLWLSWSSIGIYLIIYPSICNPLPSALPPSLFLSSLWKSENRPGRVNPVGDRCDCIRIATCRSGNLSRVGPVTMTCGHDTKSTFMERSIPANEVSKFQPAASRLIIVWNVFDSRPLRYDLGVRIPRTAFQTSALAAQAR